MTRAEEIEGYEVPLHIALTQPILMGGAPRTFAILNGTLALVIGMGLHLWWLGFPAGMALHTAAVLMSKREAPTRLYVKTSPPGADVSVDGQKVGLSDDLFQIQPGEHIVVVRRQGFKDSTRKVTLVEAEITRLEFVLEDSGQSNEGAPDAGPAAGQVAIEFLQDSPLARPILDSATSLIQQNPKGQDWSGKGGGKLFAIILRPMPKGEAGTGATPALLELVHAKCIAEIVMTKSLSDYYTQAGLTDLSSLRQAVAAITADSRVSGNMRGVDHIESVEGNWSIGLTVADPAAVTARFANPATLADVKIAYRDAVHVRARELMSQGRWEDALVLWRHLHQLKLVSQTLYLDAALCFSKLGQADQATDVLKESLVAFAGTGSEEFFERAGDLAFQIGTPGAQEFSRGAYESASAKLLDSATTQPTQTDNKPFEQ